MKKNYENRRSFFTHKRAFQWINLSTVFAMLFGAHVAFAGEGTRADSKPWQQKGLSLELKAKRSRTAKHFMNGDHTISSFISPSSIHYLNASNTWEDIETNIRVNTGVDQHTYPYAAEHNAIQTYFPSNPFSNYLLMRSREGDFKERVRAIHVLNASGQVLSSISLQGNVTAQVEGSRIIYSGFHPHLQLEYTLGNDSRKFDLVILSPQFLNNLPQQANALSIEEEFVCENGSTSVQLLRNEINIQNKGTTVLQVAQPMAFGTNSQEEEFTAGTLSMQQDGNRYIFESSFPFAWLSSGSRHFPIHLDPTVNYYPSNTTFWTGYQTSSTSKTSGQIRITSGLNQGWAKFDLSSLPPGCTVSQATYYGYHYSTTSSAKICQITGMGSVDPVPSTAGAIAAQIPSGTQYNGNYTFGGSTYSWNPGTLNSSGLTDIAAAAGNWIALGFSYLSGSTTFMYHYGINGFGVSPTPLPCYIEVIYFTVPCNSVPSANSVVTPTYEICPGTSAVLSLSNTYSVGGITYQWLSSTSSSVGPFVSVPNGTAASLVTPTVSTPTWFSVVITCSAVTGNYTATAGEVLVESTVIDNVPYYESFENIVKLNDLPNCSWSASNLGNTAQTYTAASLNNRVPRTGNKFASFYYNPATTTYFYTNGIQLNAGITYSASLWFTTEYVGYNNWTDLSILYGSSQSTTGLTSIASTNGPAISIIYKQLSNTFSVPTSGVYYIAVRATSGSGSAQYLSWDDLEITIPCSLNSPTVSLSAGTGTICAGESASILALGADSYTWSTGSTLDNISETPMFTTTYSVAATSSLSGCVSMTHQTIWVKPTPNVYAFGNPLEICAGDGAQLQAFGADSYIWSNNLNGSQINVTPNSSTVYSVTGSNANGCSAQATIQVVVNPLPMVTISGPSAITVCHGDMFALTASGAGSFTWTNNNNMILMTGNPLNDVANATTTYSVVGSDINGCENLATYVLNTSECTGIREESGVFGSLRVYPNPGNGLYSLISSASGQQTVRVTDISGKMVFTANFTGNHTELSLEHLAAGVYMLELRGDGKAARLKLIKE